MLYGRPSTLHIYDSSNAYGPAIRIPDTRGVHQDCVLGAMYFATIASRVYKRLAAVAPNESIVCAYSDDGNSLGPHASVVAIGEAVPAAYTSVDLTVTIRKSVGIQLLASTEGTKVLGGRGAVIVSVFCPRRARKGFKQVRYI
jgi:hypothetical protein